jgi:hypothetical protein
MLRSKKTLIVLASIALLYLLGFRLEHPHSGFKSAVGSASSSIVITQKSDSYSIGQKVVAASQSKELSPVLGQVTAVNGSTYSVTNGVYLETVEGKQIAGKMIVVLPFFGYLLNVVGL